MSSRHVQRGVTLIELVVTIVVIAIALVAVVGVMSQQIGRSADPMLQHQAVAIANSYMDEILLKAFVDPDTGTVCPTPEGQRDLYDNLCDYHGLDHSGARSALVSGADLAGDPIAGLERYRIRVTVDTSTGADLNGLSAAAEEVMRIDVRVNHLSETNIDYRLASYRANYP